jgi:DNA-binding NarL/FixJ family response regulator
VPKSSLKVELPLRSRLIKEGLSSVLTATGFSVLSELDERADPVTVIIDIDDCRNPKLVGAHHLRDDKIVILATGADALEVDDDQIALLSGILTYDLSLDAFVQSLRLVCSGERVFPRDLVSRRKLPAPSPGIEPRSDRSC